MTELLHPTRELVPTERQVAVGDVRTSSAPVATEPPRVEDPPAGPSFGARARDVLSSLDPRTIRGIRLPLVVFLVVSVFGNIDKGVFVIVLPELRAEFGGNAGSVLAVGTFVTLTTAFGAPFLGLLADRVSRVWLVRIAYLASNIVIVVLALTAHSFAAVFLLLGLSGLLLSVQGPGIFPGQGQQGAAAPASLMADYYDIDSCARALSMMSAAAAAGGIITPVVAGFSVDYMGGWRTATLILGIFATLVSLPTLLLREPRRGERALAELGVEPAKVKPLPIAEAWRLVSGVRTVRRIWVALGIAGAGLLGMIYYLADYWSSAFGLTPSARGYIVAAANGTTLLVLLVLGPKLGQAVARRPGRLLVLLGSFVMALSALAVVLVVSKSVALSIVASIPLTAAVGVIGPALTVLLLRLLPPDVRGLGISSIGLVTVLGSFLVLFVARLVPPAWGTRGVGLVYVPFYLVGGYLLATAAASVQRDIRAAEAATIARMAAVPEDDRTGALLVCRDVEVTYNGSVVVDRVNLDIQQGEMVALLGTNGAGKSSLLKVVCGVVRASNGAIFFDGRNITKEPPHLNVAHGVVMMPGGRAVFPTLSVRENLRSAMLAQHDTGEQVMDLDEVFALFPALQDRLEQRAGDLSGGEQQMVALGQALLMRPKLLMIDELSLGLAPAVVDQLLEALQEINRQGTTVVIVEQSLNVALTVAERAIFMDKGRIFFDGRTDELLGRPDLVRSVFMGGAATGAVSVRPRTQPHGQAEAVEAIRLEDLTVVFGGVCALDGVSLSADPRQVLGILGPNGAGKTTLFDAISGFVPARGRVLLEGVDVSAEPPDARARLGLVRSFQDARLFPSMTVRENIAVALERLASHNAAAAFVWSAGTRRNEERIRRRVDGLVDLLNLGPVADRFVSELSTGSRRAVDVAVVMASEPKVLLLDEPSSGLAQAEVEALGPVISRLARETGAAVLVIEHDLPLLSAVSHRIAALERGRLLLAGEPHEVLSDTRVLSSYLNASERSLSRSGTRLSTIAAALGAVGPDHHTTRDES